MTSAVPPVPRRRLGRTELEIPVIPFGTQGFGNHFGFVSDEDAVALIKHAVSLGVNHFDCARCYGDSLRKLGLALREIPRGDVIITGRLCCHSNAPWGGYRGDGEPDYSAERGDPRRGGPAGDPGRRLLRRHADPRPAPHRTNPGQGGHTGRPAAAEGEGFGAERGIRDASAPLPPGGDRHRRRRSHPLLQ